MSGYFNDDQPRRQRRSRRPIYEEEIIESRNGRPVRQTALIRRPRDSSSSSVEEIRRQFVPGDGTYIQRRSTVRDKYPPRDDSFVASRYSDGDVGGGRRRRRRRDDRRSHGGYSSESESSPSPHRRERRKSIGEKALEAIGLGGAAGALAGRDRARSRSRARSRAASRASSRGRSYSDSRSRSRDRSVDKTRRIQQAAKAALAAGVIEAWRSRKEPGGISGQGKRILTAAIAAGGIDGLIDKDPEKNSKRHTIEAALGGLAGNRLINGARGSSRSRSRGPGGRQDKGGPGLAGVASAAGLAALAGKAFKEYRSKSRDRSSSGDRGRGRRYDSYSDSSRSPSPRRQKKRGSSVGAVLKDGYDTVLDTFGFARESENHHPRYARDKNGNRVYDSDSDNGARPRGGGAEEKRDHGSDTDSYSSSEEEHKRRKMRGKEMLTAGLASVATIHAAHSVYQSMEARKKRHQKVMENKMTPEEARRLKSRAALQDAAAVGIAALGIKGAVSEWKEMREQQGEFKEHCKRLEEKRAHRREKIERGEWSYDNHHKVVSRDRNGDGGDGRDRSDGDGYGDGRGPRYSSSNPYATGDLSKRGMMKPFLEIGSALM